MRAGEGARESEGDVMSLVEFAALWTAIILVDAVCFGVLSRLYGDRWWQSKMRRLAYAPLGALLGLVVVLLLGRRA